MAKARLNDAIGDRGEAIFRSTMTRFHRAGPLFRVEFLGAKWPLVDFIVELEGPWRMRRPFFLVQVKATFEGYTVRSHRLKIKIDQNRAAALRGYRIPTYVAGIDLTNERVFMIAATGPRIRMLSDMHTGGEMDAVGRQLLWDEVRRFWAGLPLPSYASRFVEPKWT